MKIGYVGLGNMGGALAARLQKSVSLNVYDPNPAATAPMRDVGASIAAGLPELGAECDIIFLCLPTSDFVRRALFDEGGLLVGARLGTLIVDQSTGDPNATRAMAAELAARGIDLIDAPVSGGRAGAEAGTIAIMVGAGQAQYDRILPILQHISGNVFHAGGVGNGQVVKLVNNLMSTVQRALSFEAVALAAKCGVDPEIATSILNSGGARNAYLEKMMGPRILKGKLNVGFTLALAHKDLKLACQLGAEAGVPLFIGNSAREVYQLSKAMMGPEAQVDTIGLVFDRLSGTQVVPASNDVS